MAFKSVELFKKSIVALLLVFPLCNASAADVESVQPQNGISAELSEGQVTLSIALASQGTDFLIVRDGSEQKLVRWIRVGNQIQLVSPIVEKAIGADDHPGARLSGSVRANWLPSILESFPISDATIDGSVKIDVTKLVLSQIDGLPKGRGRVDVDRSHVIKVVNSDNLVEVLTTQTIPFDSLSEYYQQRYISQEPLSSSVYWSIIQLPQRPMRPRKFDERMGYFSDKSDLYRPDFPAGTMRWRLEKTNSLEPVGRPRRPIVFHLPQSIPNWLKLNIKAGIEEWLPAFEAAGFKDAIIVRDSPDEDPNFDQRSMRYSVVKIRDTSDIRYYNFDNRGQLHGGGTVDRIHDPRTGEILKADIILPMPSDTSRADFFAFCGALDPRASQIPFPSSLTGALMQVTTAHEAGHAFGLMDGDFGEFVYPTAKLRDKNWLETMGFTPSVMNYSRCNYVAQPEDNLPIEYLLPRVGPADIHHIRWGYTTLPEAKTWKEERPLLEKMVKEIETAPWLRYSILYNSDEISPQLYDDAIDVSDPVLATKLGVKNLQRSIQLLPAATLHEDGGNALLEQMYFQVLKRWSNMMGHVSSMIGGYTKNFKSGTDAGPVFTPISAIEQREAMAYLGEAAFKTPFYLIDRDITRRFEASGSIDNISVMQVKLLDDLLTPVRLKNFVEFESLAASGERVYRASEFLTDIRHAVWSDHADGEVIFDHYRQRLQAAHIRRIKQLIGLPAEQANIASLLKNELELLGQDIAESLAGTRTPIMRAHLELMLKAVRSE